MKRSERHHLKENAVVVAIGGLQRQLYERSRGLKIGIAVGLIAGTVLKAWRRRGRPSS